MILLPIEPRHASMSLRLHGRSAGQTPSTAVAPGTRNSSRGSRLCSGRRTSGTLCWEGNRSVVKKAVRPMFIHTLCRQEKSALCDDFLRVSFKSFQRSVAATVAPPIIYSQRSKFIRTAVMKPLCRMTTGHPAGFLQRVFGTLVQYLSGWGLCAVCRR